MTFFDPTKLSDDELQKKEYQLFAKLAWADAYGGSEIVTGLRNILDMIETEKYERYHRLVAKIQRREVQVIESDPDLAEQHKRKEEIKKDATESKKSQITKINIPRTSAPVVEIKKPE